jgi:hypothetical protein
MQPEPASYLIRRARFTGTASPERFGELSRRWEEACLAAGALPWGTFAGLLGLRTDEVFLGAARRGPGGWPSLPGVEPLDDFVGSPTARPLTPERQQSPGVYVIRRFEIATTDVDEFFRLSAEAWESFENDLAYRAEPRALLRVDAPGGATHMLLVTWYADLAAWERSRQPPPAARANFLARARLTRWALPIATRLV